MPREFEPWFVVKVGIRKSRKLTDLPDDTARYGWIAGVLAEAKLQRPGGRFASRAQLDEAVGRFAAHVDAYVALGLLEASGRLCRDCRKVWPDLPAGAYVVHGWRSVQRDPGSAERAAEWRDTHGNDGGTPDERGTNGDGTTDDREPFDHGDGVVTADSRARVVTDTGTDTTNGTGTGSSPLPPGRAGGRSSRASGTNPRALDRAAAAEVAASDQARAYRAQQRQLACYRGAITDAERVDMNARDAGLAEIPGWDDHVEAIRRSQRPTLDQLAESRGGR